MGTKKFFCSCSLKNSNPPSLLITLICSVFFSVVIIIKSEMSFLSSVLVFDCPPSPTQRDYNLYERLGLNHLLHYFILIAQAVSGT